jgi:cytoskeleton protein RodZ
MVEALEQDRYQDLPGPVFVAGYLRNYARLVGLDPEPLISAYRTANPEPERTGLHFRPGPNQVIGREIGSSHLLVRLISLGLLAAVIAMIVLWWQNRAEQLPGLTTSDSAAFPLATVAGTGLHPATRAPLAGAAGPTSQVPDTASPGLPIPAAAGNRTAPAPDQVADQAAVLPRPTTPAADEPPRRAEPAVPPSPTDTPADAPAESPAAAAKPKEVALTFSGPSWVTIRDASGTAVLHGQMRKGDTRVLTGNPPYSFVMGNAGNVHITVGGKPLDLSRRAQGNVARFKLDPSNPE